MAINVCILDVCFEEGRSVHHFHMIDYELITAVLGQHFPTYPRTCHISDKHAPFATQVVWKGPNNFTNRRKNARKNH